MSNLYCHPGKAGGSPLAFRPEQPAISPFYVIIADHRCFTYTIPGRDFDENRSLMLLAQIRLMIPRRILCSAKEKACAQGDSAFFLRVAPWTS